MVRAAANQSHDPLPWIIKFYYFFCISEEATCRVILLIWIVNGLACHPLIKIIIKNVNCDFFFLLKKQDKWKNNKIGSLNYVRTALPKWWTTVQRHLCVLVKVGGGITSPCARQYAQHFNYFYQMGKKLCRHDGKFKNYQNGIVGPQGLRRSHLRQLLVTAKM